MSLIPVLAVPVLNRGDLLQRLLRSIDYPVGRLVIVNNGDDPGVQQVLDQDVVKHAIETLIHKPGYNLGVAASWNWVMRTYPAIYWLFIGNDIKLAPGDLAKIDAFIKAHPDYATVPANWGHSLFAVTKAGLDAVGFFDENLYPAYCEDQDWMYRLKLAGLPWGDCPGCRAVHGEPPLWGSTTVWSRAELTAKCRVTQTNNHEYYARKWGGRPGEETFTRPFDSERYTLKDCPLDLELAEANGNPMLEAWKREDEILHGSGDEEPRGFLFGRPVVEASGAPKIDGPIEFGEFSDLGK